MTGAFPCGSFAARLGGFGHGHELASAFVEDDAVTVAVHVVSSLEIGFSEFLVNESKFGPQRKSGGVGCCSEAVRVR
jgi:hypothetical protein